jgi:hypothetical protein
VSPTTTTRLATSAIAVLLTVVVVYVVLRVASLLLGHEPDPATVIWSGNIAFFWRLAMGAYIGGAVGIVVFRASAKHLEATTRVVLRAVLPVALAIALQGMLLP